VDQGTLVGEQLNDGRRFVERFAADGNAVKAAFWVQTEEDGLWFLYVAADVYDRMGPAGSYRAVRDALAKLDKCSISGSDIKIISLGNPIAKDAIALSERHPEGIAAGVRSLGSLAVQQTIVYPSRFFTFTQSDPMTSEEIGKELLRLMNRGPGVLHPSVVTLKDGTAFTGLPFSLELGNGSMTVRFIEHGVTTPRVVPMDEIASVA
jgi:hypothetical protein